MKWIVTGVIAGLLVLSCSSPTEPDEPPPPPEAVKAFYGYVYDSLQSKPIKDVFVTVTCLDCEEQNKPHYWKATTDKNGYYEMKAVPPIDHNGHMLFCTAENIYYEKAEKFCRPQRSGAYEIPYFILVSK